MPSIGTEYRQRAGEDHDIRMQMPVLYAWAHQPGVKIIELGTRSGMSTCAFLAGITRSRTGGELWSVDIQQPQVPRAWRDYAFWHLLVADDRSPEAVAFCPDNADVLFLDTSHLYEPTLTELRLYMPKVRHGGIALFHDSDTPGTGPAWPDVPRVLDDYCAEAGLSWYNHRGWNGLGVIEVP